MIVSGLSHSKVVDILRKAEGTVQLTICRDLPLTYAESPAAPNMSAQSEAVLAEQPAPVSSPDACTCPDVMQNDAHTSGTMSLKTLSFFFYIFL